MGDGVYAFGIYKVFRIPLLTRFRRINNMFCLNQKASPYATASTIQTRMTCEVGGKKLGDHML